MQDFWTNELIAVVGLGLLGFILLTFAMAWLQKARVVKRVGGERGSWVSGTSKLIERTEEFIPGERVVLFTVTSALVLMVGAIGVLLFAFDLWEAPMYVNIMDLNAQFIFIIFAIFTFMISLSVAALYVWSRSSKRGGYR